MSKLLFSLKFISNVDVWWLVSGFETRVIWSEQRAVVRGSVGFRMMSSVVFDKFRNRIDVVLRFIMNWVRIFCTVGLLFLQPLFMIYFPLLDIILLIMIRLLHIICAGSRRRRRRLRWNHRFTFIAFFIAFFFKRSRQTDSFLVFSFFRLETKN